MKVKLIVSVLLVVLIVGCSSTQKVKHDDVIRINKVVETNYDVINNIETYIERPSLNWEISVSNEEFCDLIYYDLAKNIKSEDLYDKLRNHYSDYFNRIVISMVDSNDEIVFEYVSYYYVKGSDIYGDDTKNKIDNFETWYIRDIVNETSEEFNISNDSF